ncbi:hypothetical protein CAF53_11760 [Sphingobium sp. LB126]|uniref:hypothetical protein n=1 Tax=Sphingobium sp. LB126 TaxID=1983755 RepID=UPI000C20E260|nr:hypothetical protein [Sphingobium sp. LB126]PJG48841.1 hypothetical protein CAF53_11760 [Sphingobium sp. LB126]
MPKCENCGLTRRPDKDICICGFEFTTGYYEAAARDRERVANAPGASIYVPGWILVVIGLVALVIAFNVQTTVSAEVPYDSSLLSGLTHTSEVQNIGLLQKQMMLFQGGALAVLAGIIAAHRSAAGAMGEAAARGGATAADACAVEGFTTFSAWCRPRDHRANGAVTPAARVDAQNGVNLLIHHQALTDHDARGVR